MNNFRINNMSNMNNIDEFISNQGFMSERTKSPRRIMPNMVHNQFFEANDQYQNINRINSNRDMSPNKLIVKNRPLLANNVMNNVRIPPVQNNFQNNYHGSFIENQNSFGFNTKVPQQSNNWKNIKSPRSPHQTQFLNNNQHQNIPKKCANHQNKKAEYMTQTQGEFIHYCETCAAKLAANNFEVIKLPVSGFNNQFNHPQKPKLHYQRRQIPSIPEYKGNQIYESIIEFLKEVFTVEHEHYEGYEDLEKIDQHYEHQIEMVDEFYRQIQQILAKMHQDHIADIEKEHKKHSQMKDIYLNDIHDNLESINDIIKDLEDSFETVVTDIRKEHIQHFNNALQQNRIQVRFYKNKIQQQKDTLKEIISYKEERLSDMIGEFQKCLTTLWQEPQQVKPQVKPQNLVYQKNITHVSNPPIRQPNMLHQQQNSFNINVSAPMSNNVLQPNNRQNLKPNDQKFNIMQIHQNSQKSGLTREFEGKGACRQIFEDDEDENQLEQQVSPNFKKI